MQTIYLLANGDMRLAVNQQGWPAQGETEARLTAALEREGREVRRAHAFDPAKEHGFIDSLRVGLAVFRAIPADAPIIVITSGWQCSHHVWPGLAAHRGPILTVGHWGAASPGGGGDARSQRRWPDPGGREAFQPVEREFRGRIFHGGVAAVAGEGEGSAGGGTRAPV